MTALANLKKVAQRADFKLEKFLERARFLTGRKEIATLEDLQPMEAEALYQTIEVTCQACSSNTNNVQTEFCDRCWEINRRLESLTPRARLFFIEKLRGW